MRQSAERVVVERLGEPPVDVFGERSAEPVVSSVPGEVAELIVLAIGDPRSRSIGIIGDKVAIAKGVVAVSGRDSFGVFDANFSIWHDVTVLHTDEEFKAMEGRPVY